MNLLLAAAKAWQELLQTEYCITVGRRGKTASFRLQFGLADFPHLAGMQYARDVDFGLREAEYYGEKLVPALLSGALDGRRLEQGRNWEKIKGRLHAILHLKATLESDFLIAWFDPSKVRTYSQIGVKYVVTNLNSGETYFVFIDENSEHRHYCKSAFTKADVDYIQNQPRLTVLKKEKIEGGSRRTLYRHPNFKEEPVGER